MKRWRKPDMQNQTKPADALIRPEEVPNILDPRTKEEINAIESQTLSAASLRNEHIRKEKLRTVFAWGVGGLLIVMFVLFGLALVFLAWHYLAPKNTHWMSDEDLKSVGTALSSGTIFAFLGHYLRERL